MPAINKTVLLAHPRQTMFDLVAGVEQYPEFLPWCGGASVQPQPDGSVLATVKIAFKGISQSFSTLNRHVGSESIEMALADGPFRELHGRWTFVALREDACRVDFSLEYQFGSGLLARALSPVFDHIAGSMVDAFVRRANQLYGESV